MPWTARRFLGISVAGSATAVLVVRLVLDPVLVVLVVVAIVAAATATAKRGGRGGGRAVVALEVDATGWESTSRVGSRR